MVDDGSEVRAPIAGLVAGLRAAATDLCVVVPVDCPGLSEDVLRRLAAAAGDAAVPQTGPLPGAYRRRVLPVLEEQLASGDLALHGALVRLSVAVVEVEPSLLVNANTPADLAAPASDS